MKKLIIPIFVLTLSSSSVQAQNHARINAEALLSHVKTMSSDEFGGRLAGSESGAETQRYLIQAFSETGVPACGDEYRQEFEIRSRRGAKQGGNILGLIPGTSESTDVIVVSAHFDHLGIRSGQIYNGADDNASGTAALIEVAAYFLDHPLAHSLLIAAFDAEEGGLQGSRAFLQNPCVDVERLAININMDMISRSDSSELYVSGTYHYPPLMDVVKKIDVSEDIHLLFGHDLPNTGSDDWTSQSDQGPFFQQGIPHLYFGVEDHAGYHRPNDVFEDITPSFYVDAVELIVDVLIEIDQNMDVVRSLEKR